MMPRTRLCLILALLGIGVGGAGGIGGCQSIPPAVDNPASIDAAQYETVYHAAIATLRDHGFRVNRRDHRFGQIITQPLDSPTIFEPWRDHNITTDQALASTTAHLQRRIHITFNTDDKQQYAMAVQVMLERRQFPLRRLTGTALPQRFSSLKQLPTDYKQRGITEKYHLPVERDLLYEQRLIYEIMQRADTGE